MSRMETINPVADEWTEEYATYVASSRSVLLTESLATFLVSSVEAGRRPVLLTAADARISSIAMLALGRAGAFWAVRDESGVYDGLTGYRISAFSDLWGRARVDQPRLAGYGEQRPDALAVMMFEVYAHHRVSGTVSMGRLAQSAVTGLGGAELDVWGHVEPLATHWNDAALTETIRRTMPDSDVLHARAGDGSFAAISAGRTKRGVLELVKGGVPVGPYAPPTAELLERATTMLTRVHAEMTPTLGLVSVAELDAGVTQRAAARRPEAPVAVLLGPAVLHDLDADLETLQRRHDATVLGRARVPSLLIRFGAKDRGMWEQLLRLAADLGPENVRAAMLLEGS